MADGDDPRRWLSWAKFRRPNAVLRIVSAAYVGISVAIIAVGHAAFDEARDALNSNVAHSLTLPAPAPAPCGLATPDLTMLQQALGVNEFGLLQPMDYTPQYFKLVEKTSGMLCSRDQAWATAGDDTDGADTDEVTDIENQARLLRGLSKFMKKSEYQATTPVTALDVDEKTDALRDELCRLDDSDERTIYSKRLQVAYPDLRLRVERAYQAAAPAFWRYDRSKTSDGSCLGVHDPFSEFDSSTSLGCKNSHFVALVLGRAAHAVQQKSMVASNLAGATTDWLEKLYALLLLPPYRLPTDAGQSAWAQAPSASHRLRA